ncbi:hypothetical protein ATANTOWER_015379 [Ataeniobius toweri]|uniref:Secreted protein n=1 Tax=Ataeniobius toweri TaxID=208326 RepID=A0ABU7BSS3_9TELE|nr:hypothetical protein [Ataeniobius toweri]
MCSLIPFTHAAVSFLALPNHSTSLQPAIINLFSWNCANSSANHYKTAAPTLWCSSHGLGFDALSFWVFLHRPGSIPASVLQHVTRSLFHRANLTNSKPSVKS